jgi:hypothetical protein
LAATTDLPVWPSKQAFCSKSCHDSYFSLKNIAAMLAGMIGYPVAILAPWIAFFYVDQGFGFTGIGLLAGFGALALTAVLISFPIYKWLNR